MPMNHPALPSTPSLDPSAAFAQLAHERQLLQRHLHGLAPAVAYLVARAEAAIHNKNLAKKYFDRGNPTPEALARFKAALGEEARSEALFAIQGKQALYAECVEIALANASLTGCQALKALCAAYERTRGDLVLANQKLVWAVISKLGKIGMELEDLFQQGVVGLQKAVEGYDLRTGNRFSTYAMPVIRGEIVRGAENFSLLIRLPSHAWGSVRELWRVRNELEQEFGESPTTEEIATALGVSLEEVAERERLTQEPLSLFAPLNGEESGLTLADTLRVEACTPFVEEDGEGFLEPYWHDLDPLEREALAWMIREVDFTDGAWGRGAVDLGVTGQTLRAAFESGASKIRRMRGAALAA